MMTRNLVEFYVHIRETDCCALEVRLQGPSAC